MPRMPRLTDPDSAAEGTSASATVISFEDIDDLGREIGGGTFDLDALALSAVWGEWQWEEGAVTESAGFASLGIADPNAVDFLGLALGVSYEEGEPLCFGEKERERDRHRWELDPASAEDFGQRSRTTSPAAAPTQARNRRAR